MRKVKNSIPTQVTRILRVWKLVALIRPKILTQDETKPLCHIHRYNYIVITLMNVYKCLIKVNHNFNRDKRRTANYEHQKSPKEAAAFLSSLYKPVPVSASVSFFCSLSSKKHLHSANYEMLRKFRIKKAKFRRLSLHMSLEQEDNNVIT